MRDHFIEAGGFRTRYRTIGQGPVPLVMLHGLAGRLEDWGGAFAALARGRRVIALDLLGCGYTDPLPGADYTPDRMRDHVLSFLDAMQIERADLNGWSMGGRIAFDVAHAAPDRLRRLVVTAPAGVGPDSLLDPGATGPAMMGQALVRSLGVAGRVLRHAAGQGTLPGVMGFAARRVGTAGRSGTRAAFRNQMGHMIEANGFLPGPRAELLNKLPFIETPTLAIWGRLDKYVPAQHAEILAARMPDCKVLVLDRCGHMLQYERPRAYVAALNRFLE